MTEKKVKQGEARGTCFLVGPIGAANSEPRRHADWVAHIVQKALAGFNLNVVRADGIPSPGLITAQIIDHIMNAELVIADLTFLNANAFYELGIRHAAQKATIHVFREDETIPFDVADSRAISFNYSHPIEIERATAAIQAAAETVFEPNHKVWSPVTSAMAFSELSHSKEDKDRLIASLIERIDRLERREMSARTQMHARTQNPIDTPIDESLQKAGIGSVLADTSLWSAKSVSDSIEANELREKAIRWASLKNRQK